MFDLHRWSIFVVGVLCSLSAGAASAGTKVTLGRNVASSQRYPLDRINHQSWNALLKKYVDGGGNIDYRAWKASAADVGALNAYLNHLSHGDPSRASKSAKLAFWINTYNAVTIKGILREYPTSSIRNHTAKLFGYNIWHDLLLVVGGQSYSLDQIEHKILRKTSEPRIHFAIVCASRSCPRLLNQAYTPEKVDEQLELNSRAFFAQAGNFRYDARASRIYLSSIIDWFEEDFGSSQAARLRTIARWLPDAASRKAAAAGRASVSYLDYDWRLNDQATARTARR